MVSHPFRDRADGAASPGSECQGGPRRRGFGTLDIWSIWLVRYCGELLAHRTINLPRMLRGGLGVRVGPFPDSCTAAKSPITGRPDDVSDVWQRLRLPTPGRGSKGRAQVI